MKKSKVYVILIQGKNKRSNWWCGINQKGEFEKSKNCPLSKAAKIFWDEVEMHIKLSGILEKLNKKENKK